MLSNFNVAGDAGAINAKVNDQNYSATIDDESEVELTCEDIQEDTRYVPHRYYYLP